MITFRPQVKFDQKAIIVLVTEEHVKSKTLPLQNASLQKAYLASAGTYFDGKAGAVFPVMFDKGMAVLTGVGKADKLTATSLRIIIRKALTSHFLCPFKKLELVLHDDAESSAAAAIEAVEIGTYRWDKYFSPDRKKKCLPQKNVSLVCKATSNLKSILEICQGVNLTRNLVNDNADFITSLYFESMVKDLTKGRKDISLEILGEKEMKKKGLGLHLAVNQGSNKPPRLIIVQYTGDAKSKDYTAVIGKGVTFDTGGLNLKPTNNIESMRYDMGGAGAVMGIMHNVLSLKPKVNAIFVMGLAENAIDANSYKPGDVISGYDGKTVEIGNTDAEGRLVLADAISYVVKNYKPARLIDLATLTGACVVALGHDYTGLFSNNDDFAADMLTSAETTDDRAWRMPIYPELKELVKSKIADIKNIGVIRSAAGSCTAAEFLRQFTKDTPWVHLDIAGTSFADGCGRWYFGYGATGSGVRLVTRYLLNYKV